eukprot:11240298-Alexandrium_andersonii.AAC.1
MFRADSESHQVRCEFSRCEFPRCLQGLWVAAALPSECLDHGVSKQLLSAFSRYYLDDDRGVYLYRYSATPLNRKKVKDDKGLTSKSHTDVVKLKNLEKTSTGATSSVPNPETPVSECNPRTPMSSKLAKSRKGEKLQPVPLEDEKVGQPKGRAKHFGVSAPAFPPESDNSDAFYF